MHKLSEFEEINPMLKKVECGSKKMVLKFDIDTTCKLSKLQDLTKAVANILRLRKSALRLLSIEKGCVVATFLIPAPVADFIFSSGKIFPAGKIEEFQAQSLLLLECNGFKYDFNKLNDRSKDTSGMSNIRISTLSTSLCPLHMYIQHHTSHSVDIACIVCMLTPKA